MYSGYQASHSSTPERSGAGQQPLYQG